MKETDNEKKIVLVGGGGHALSILEAMTDPGRVSGYLALSPSDDMPLEWLGNDEMAPALAEDHLFHLAFIYCGRPDMRLRGRIIAKYSAFGARFATVIASTSVVTRNARLGGGCAVMHRAVINRAILGNNVVINTGAIVEHDCIVGDNSFVGPGAVIGGGVKIGRNCFIGLGADIRNGVEIADGVSVGMGAVITRDLLLPGFYRGNPLRFSGVDENDKNNNDKG